MSRSRKPSRVSESRRACGFVENRPWVSLSTVTDHCRCSRTRIADADAGVDSGTARRAPTFPWPLFTDAVHCRGLRTLIFSPGLRGRLSAPPLGAFSLCSTGIGRSAEENAKHGTPRPRGALLVSGVAGTGTQRGSHSGYSVAFLFGSGLAFGSYDVSEFP